MNIAMRDTIVRFGYKMISKGVKLPDSGYELVSNALNAIYLRDLLNRMRINLALDIGAHHGSFVRHLRRIGFKGHIISFEPNPLSFEILSKAHGKDPCWKGFNIGVGSKNTTMPFYMTDLSCLSSFLKPRSAEVISTQMIEVKRLDHILKDLLSPVKSPRMFVKIDTQGYDMEVIEGASGCMDMIRGFQSEISVVPIYENMPHYLDALRFYESLGFKLMNLFTVTRSPGCGNVVEYDCLMARPKAIVDV